MLGGLLTSATLLFLVVTECAEPHGKTDTSAGDDDETVVDSSSDSVKSYELIGYNDVRLKFRKERPSSEVKGQDKEGQKNDGGNNDAEDSDYIVDFEIFPTDKEEGDDAGPKERRHGYVHAGEKYFLKADARNSELVFVKQESVDPEVARTNPPSLSSEFVFVFERSGKRIVTMKHKDSCVVPGDENIALLGKCDAKESQMGLVSPSRHIFGLQPQKETGAVKQENAGPGNGTNRTSDRSQKGRPVEEEVVKKTNQKNAEGSISKPAASKGQEQEDTTRYRERRPTLNRRSAPKRDGRMDSRRAGYDEVEDSFQRGAAGRGYPGREQRVENYGASEGVVDSGYQQYAPETRKGVPYAPQNAPSYPNNPPPPPPPASWSNPPPQTPPNPQPPSAPPQPNSVDPRPPSYQPPSNQPTQVTRGSPPSRPDPSNPPTAPEREAVYPPPPPQPSQSPQPVQSNEQPPAPPQPQDPPANKNLPYPTYTQPPEYPPYDAQNPSSSSQQAPPPSPQSQPPYPPAAPYPGYPPLPPNDPSYKPVIKNKALKSLYQGVKAADALADAITKPNPSKKVGFNVPTPPGVPSFPF